jgi:hypothetical protein
MKLKVVERFNLLNILPKESNFATLKIVRELQNNLSLDDEENKTIEAKTNGMQVTWNPEKCLEYDKTPKDIKIVGKAHSIIVEELTKLDQQNRLPLGMFDLFDQFINGISEPAKKKKSIKEE